MLHESKIKELLLAKADGYEITFIGVSLARPELNVARVALRVSEGGHDVPTDRILARYERTMNLTPQAMLIADRSLIFDNSYSAVEPLLVLTSRIVQPNSGASQLNLRISKTWQDDFASWVHRYLVDGLKPACQDQGIELVYGAALVP